MNKSPYEELRDAVLAYREWYWGTKEGYMISEREGQDRREKMLNLAAPKKYFQNNPSADPNEK